MIWIVTLACYGALVSVALVAGHRKRLRRIEEETENLIKAASRVRSIEGRAKLLGSLSELQKAATPWYERSLSTIGVVGFFSMSLAAGVQTISANLSAARAERLEDALEDLQEERNAAENFVNQVSKMVVSGALPIRTLGRAERELLRFRLDRLRAKEKLEIAEAKEMYTLALAIRDFHSAVSIFEQYRELLEGTSAGDQVSLAEYYYLVGSQEAARELIEELWEKRSTSDRLVVRRMSVLRVLIGHALDEEARELARLFRTRQSEALAILSREVEAFQEGARRLAVAEANGAGANR